MPEAVPEPGPPVSQNISELVRQLTREDRGQYLYRGQTKHYGVVTPSTFRRALTGEPCEIEHLRRISTEAFNRALTTEQSRLRFDLLEYLITSLGRAVGNIIAQQYGITSEAIDVTSSIEVAAFFATHDYPSYQHFNGTADRPLGVIYRFPNFTKVRDLGRIERCLEEMGHIGRHGREVWFERCPKLFELSGENRERAYRYLDQHEREDAILFSPPMVVDYRALTEPLEEALKDAWKLTPRWLQHTRLGRQVGGFVLPPVHWRCVLPRKKQIIEAEILLRHDYYEPGTAFREEIVAIEDTMNFPGIETFFFKHSEDRAESMTKEYLWPSSQDDDVYAHLLERCLHEREIVEYLEREDIWAEHPEKGIIDRGYYTGHEMLGWKTQVAY
jgi:hypothetical protein